MESSNITQYLSTVRDYIRWASSEFYRNQLTFAHGFERPLDEAVYLVLYALDLPWDWPQEYFDTSLTDKERERVVAVIRQRIKTRQPGWSGNEEHGLLQGTGLEMKIVHPGWQRRDLDLPIAAARGLNG